jgi:hypothetical protein
MAVGGRTVQPPRPSHDRRTAHRAWRARPEGHSRTRPRAGRRPSRTPVGQFAHGITRCPANVGVRRLRPGSRHAENGGLPQRTGPSTDRVRRPCDTSWSATPPPRRQGLIGGSFVGSRACEALRRMARPSRLSRGCRPRPRTPRGCACTRTPRRPPRCIPARRSGREGTDCQPRRRSQARRIARRASHDGGPVSSPDNVRAVVPRGCRAPIPTLVRASVRTLS